MPDNPNAEDYEIPSVSPEPLEFAEEEVPASFVVWGGIVHTFLYAFYFLGISCVAIAIDLGLHWFETLCFVERYKLSGIIRWEVELMAYTLATVDTFLFIRVLIQPGIQWLVRTVRRHE